MHEPLPRRRTGLSGRTALAVLFVTTLAQIGLGGLGATDAAAGPPPPVATTTIVSVSTTSVVYGGESAAVVTVTVTPDEGDPVTDGTTVPVTVGTGPRTATCTATLTGDTGTCTIADTALAAGGPYPIAADYAGNASYAGSVGNAPTGLTVGQDTTTTTLTANSTTVASGHESSVIFTIVVTTGLGEAVPDGETVQIGIDGLFCTVTLSGGTGTCSIPDSALPGGQSYGVYADYDGDTDLAGSFGYLQGGLTVTGSVDYLLVGRDGDVYTFGSAVSHGSLTASHITPAAPIVGIATTIGDEGYWLVGADGGVFAFGDAVFHGSLPASGISPAQPIVGVATTPDGDGYWLVGADGGVFAFGDAVFHGSAVGTGLEPVTAIVASPDGGGYALVDRYGAVSVFGDAVDSGAIPPVPGTSTSTETDTSLLGPIVAVAANAQGTGYWMAGSDGGVFAFGVPFAGSLESTHRAPGAPITGIATWVTRPFSCSVAGPHRITAGC